MIRVSDKKLVVVCGDSWLSPRYNSHIEKPIDEHHFSQILVEKIGWDLVYLSMPGVSNYCIFDQIRTAIAINPDLIIFNTTAPERYEVTLDNINFLTYHGVYVEFPILKYFHTQYDWFKKLLGIDDVLPYIISSGNEDINHLISYFSYMIPSLEKDVAKCLKDKKEDIKGYVNISNYYINKDYDSYLLKGIISEMVDANIPYICMMDSLELKHVSFNKDNNILNFKEVLSTVEAENKNLGLTFKDVPHYHTIQSRQYEFAKIVFNSMKRLNLLSNNLDFDSNTI